MEKSCGNDDGDGGGDGSSTFATRTFRALIAVVTGTALITQFSFDASIANTVTISPTTTSAPTHVTGLAVYRNGDGNGDGNGS